MFDGNHRSNRRQVNLGGRINRSLSKKSILAQSKQQREERKRKAQQEAAARHAQRLFRGRRDRRKISIYLDELLAKSDGDVPLTAFHRAVNVRLGLACNEPDRFDAWISRLDARRKQEGSPTYPMSHRILQFSLKGLQHRPDAAAYISVLQQLMPSSYAAIGGRQGFLVLLETILDLGEKHVSLSFLNEMAARVAPDTPAGRAAMGLVQLASPVAAPSSCSNDLIQLISLSDDDAQVSEDLLAADIRKIIGGYEPHLLLRSLHSQPYVALILLHRLWNLNVLEATGCVIRGESLDALTTESFMYEAMDADDEDSDGNLDETSMGKQKKNARQELRTIPKLDRHFDETRKSRRKEVLPTALSSKTTVELAQQLGQPQLWLDWAKQIFQSDHEGVGDARAAFVVLLSFILGTSTGLKARQSARSPFLTKLAFDTQFCELIWSSFPTPEAKMMKDATILHGLLVFADVLAHQLIALRDDQFLQRYTNESVHAKAIVERYRDFLYHLYWVDPVKADDFDLRELPGNDVAFVRARLILSGTKLWNTLYERWCRLFRTARFCEESTWLFPPLVSLVGGSAVVGDADDMDIGSDSEDENQYHNAMDVESDALANAFGDPKMARILTYIPQALPFEKRVKLFDSLLQYDKSITQNEDAEMAMLAMMRGADGGFGRERVNIRRDKLYDDSMTQLSKLGAKLKRKVQVTFINQHGTQEAGIDGGGVFKEFIDELIKTAFLPAEEENAVPSLFTATPLQMLAINPDEAGNAELFPHYEFLGRVLGKAVYESILVEPQFCLPFLNLLIGRRNSLDDLKNLDPEYHRNLTQLLTLDSSTMQDLGLSFELSVGNERVRTIELVSGGRNKPVTSSNVVEYVHLVANYRLNVMSSSQVMSFLRGFQSIIPSPWVRLFSSYELQKLVSGDDSVQGIDVNALKASMQYAAGYHPSQPIMESFWEVVSEMKPDQQRKFLRFMTSCSRQPLLGFSSLEPAPCVQQIRLGDAFFERPDYIIAKEAPLPTSSTCMNLLKLPNYRDKELLRAKLLAAIESGAGFELT